MAADPFVQLLPLALERLAGQFGGLPEIQAALSGNADPNRIGLSLKLGIVVWVERAADAGEASKQAERLFGLGRQRIAICTWR